MVPPVGWLRDGFVTPVREELATGHHLRPIREADVAIDYPAVMGSRERLWAKYADTFGWPPATMTYEEDRKDLARHEAEQAVQETFNFAILDEDETELLGCIYIDPPSPHSPAGSDAMVSWWVVDQMVGSELERALDEFVPGWLAEVWGFGAVDYRPSNQSGLVTPVPEHLHTVTPRLVVRRGVDAVDFYKRAFGAEEIGDRFSEPGGKLIHAEIRIGDSVVMITEEADNGGPACSPESLGGRVSAVMATYWDDVDAAWERALAAGAEIVYPLADHFYGERGGRLRDPFGQQWMLSQHIEDVSGEEMERRMAELSQSG
jgi:uncharacterized glyoxalase superfamily protein PhnB